MRATIDAAGRMVIPRPLREELGFSAGAELEVTAVDGHLEVAMPSRVTVDRGPHGVRFTTETEERLTTERVRQLMERGRR